MRIGSSVIHTNHDSADNIRGIVIELHETDLGDYERLDHVTVRTDDGRLVKLDADEVEDVTPRNYANLYMVHQCYGGPEEGGWWFDRMTPVEPDDDWEDAPPPHGHFATPEAAKAAMIELEAWCDDENAKRPELHSSISSGVFRCYLEPWPAEVDPATKPHYC